MEYLFKIKNKTRQTKLELNIVFISRKEISSFHTVFLTSAGAIANFAHWSSCGKQIVTARLSRDLKKLHNEVELFMKS